MKINVAVFIIGSLFWDPHQGKHKNLRKEWRRRRLLMDGKIHVKAPIRYGRESGSDDNKQFTMVFSKSCDSTDKFGSGYIVPFKRRPIKSIKGLENQARFLSKAEGGSDNKLCKGKTRWCTIGLLFNPNMKEELKGKILYYWKCILEKDGGLKDFQEYKIGNEASILSEKGEILIKWPKAIDCSEQSIIDSLDIVIATCTKPNLSEYPSVEALKKVAYRDKRKYFYKNIMHGITTFQDRSILE